jgi:hypothetical protein
MAFLLLLCPCERRIYFVIIVRQRHLLRLDILICESGPTDIPCKEANRYE